MLNLLNGRQGVKEHRGRREKNETRDVGVKHTKKNVNFQRFRFPQQKI